MTYDPLAPTTASSSIDKSTFGTLKRERAFRHPPSNKSDVPALDELVKPHLESFNALIEDGADGTGKGLLQMGVEDIGEKVIFDGEAVEGAPFGTKIACESRSMDMHGSYVFAQEVSCRECIRRKARVLISKTE